MHLRIWRWLAGILLVVSCQAADQGLEEFQKWAGRKAIPIGSLQSGLAILDFNDWKGALGSAKIVALGESAHGMHEWLVLRNALFTFLVENCGFTAIALETGFPESSSIQDFVAGAPGQAAQVVQRGMSWGFGGFPENVALVEWVRRYNSNPATRRKLHFYGIDLSLGGPNGSAPTPAAIRQTLAYLDKAGPDEAKRFRLNLEKLIAQLPDPHFTAQEQDQLTGSIDALLSTLKQNKAAFIAATSQNEYDRALRNAIVAKQGDGVLRVLPSASGSTIPPDAWRAMAARDEAMAENVQWAVDQEGDSGRILLFAHNIHVKNEATKGGIWRGLAELPVSMGLRLKTSLKEKILIIGASSDSKSTSLDLALSQLRIPRFLLNLSSSGETAAGAWLAKPQTLLTNLDSFLTNRDTGNRVRCNRVRRSLDPLPNVRAVT